jgi:integral membrane protein
MNDLLDKALPYFKKVAFLEGCSYLLFALTMPLKYVLKIPQPNYVVGMAHGVLFLSYCLLLLAVWYKYKWNFAKVCFVFVMSLIPFGTFWGNKKIFNENVSLRN